MSESIKQNSLSPEAYSKPTSYRWVITSILFVVVTIAFLDRLNISVLIADPRFLADLGIKGDTVKMGMLMSGFLIAYGFSSICLSPFGDILGPRLIMTMAAVLWGMAMLLGGITTSFAILLTSRVILGLGEGLHWSMQSKFCKNWFPGTELGKANSIWLVGAKVGPVVAVPVFSYIVATYSWHWTFYLMAVLSLVMIGLIWFFTADTPEQSRWVNKAEIAHIREGEAPKEQSREEKRAAFKRDFKLLIVNKNFWTLTMCYIVQCCIFYGMLTWLPSYLKVARGFSWSQMGGYTALTWILAATMTVLTGAISDRWGRRAPFLIIGLFGAAAGIYVSAMLQDNLQAAWAITIGAGLSGCSMGAIWALVPRIVPKDAVGSGSGILGGAGMVFAAFIPTIIGYFISTTGSFNGGLMTIVAIGLFGAFCGLILTIRKF